MELLLIYVPEKTSTAIGSTTNSSRCGESIVFQIRTVQLTAQKCLRKLQYRIHDLCRFTFPLLLVQIDTGYKRWMVNGIVWGRCQHLLPVRTRGGESGVHATWCFRCEWNFSVTFAFPSAIQCAVKHICFRWCGKLWKLIVKDILVRNFWNCIHFR